METINHEYYVSLEIAKLLKEAGFNWECNRHYTEGRNILFERAEKGSVVITRNQPEYPSLYFAPTLEVAQKWLREVKGIEIYAHVFYDTYDTSEGWDVYVYEVNHITKQIEDWINSYDVYHSYEEAQEAGIKKVLEIILEKGE